MTDIAARSLPWKQPRTWCALLAAAIFAAMGVRAVLAPVGASAFFGVALDGGAGLAFVQAFGARNVALAAVAAILVALDHRRALSLLLLAAAFVACVDALAVYGVSQPLFAAKHAGYAVGLSAFSAWVGLRR